MRCRAVCRAIAVPDGAIPEAEIEAHLASCPRCASRAEAARRLDRLWESTRPEPVAPASWDAAWARIDRAVCRPEPVAPPPPARPSIARLPIRLAVGLALAAAAVLLAVNLPGPSPRKAGGGPVYGVLDVPVGHTVLYHVDSAERRVIQVSEPGPPGDDELTFFGRSEAGLDDVDYFVLFGWFEAIPALMASAPSEDGTDPFGPPPASQ